MILYLLLILTSTFKRKHHFQKKHVFPTHIKEYLANGYRITECYFYNANTSKSEKNPLQIYFYFYCLKTETFSLCGNKKDFNKVNLLDLTLENDYGKRHKETISANNVSN